MSYFCVQDIHKTNYFIYSYFNLQFNDLKKKSNIFSNMPKY